MKVKIKLTRIDGRLAFFPPIDSNEKELLKQVFSVCKERYHNEVLCTFEKPVRKRTTGRRSQNSCFYGYATCIANYTGDTVEDIMHIAKTRAVRRGYPYKKDDAGNVVYSKLTGEPLPESSAKISTVEAGCLIEELQQIAAELGVILPRTLEEQQGCE